MRIFSTLLLFLVLFNQSVAQPEMKSVKGNPLITLLDSTRKLKVDSLRLKINEEFLQQVTETLRKSPVDLSVFDTLNIGKIYSDDGLISIYCWNIQQNNGENYYSAVIRNNRTNLVIPLHTQKSYQNIATDKVFKNGEWPGGLFYKIITRKTGDKTIYTLLSWDRFSRNAARKSIEFLDFDSNGKPQFGALVFKTKEGLRHRVVYEYASQSSFTMNYSRQKITLTGVRRSQRNLDDYVIVLDRLIPLNENLTGQNWAMVPAGNTHDAYVFLDGFWIFTENIIARNPATDKKTQKVSEKPEQGLIPGK